MALPNGSARRRPQTRSKCHFHHRRLVYASAVRIQGSGGDKERSVLASSHYKAPATGSNTVGLVSEPGSKPVPGGQSGLEPDCKETSESCPGHHGRFFPSSTSGGGGDRAGTAKRPLLRTSTSSAAPLFPWKQGEPGELLGNQRSCREAERVSPLVARFAPVVADRC